MSTFVVGKEEYDDSVDAAKAIHEHPKGRQMFRNLFGWMARDADKELGDAHDWICDQVFDDKSPIVTISSILEMVAKASAKDDTDFLIDDGSGNDIDPDEIVGVLTDHWYEGCIGDAEALGSPDAEPMTIEVTVKITI